MTRVSRHDRRIVGDGMSRDGEIEVVPRARRDVRGPL